MSTWLFAALPGESRDYITLGGEIIIAMLSAFAIVAAAYVTAVLGPRLKAAREDAAAAKAEAEEARQEQADDRAEMRTLIESVLHQVKNDHGTNLRDDLDAFRDEVHRGFESMHQRVDGVNDRLDRHIDRS